MVRVDASVRSDGHRFSRLGRNVKGGGGVGVSVAVLARARVRLRMKGGATLALSQAFASTDHFQRRHLLDVDERSCRSCRGCVWVRVCSVRWWWCGGVAVW